MTDQSISSTGTFEVPSKDIINTFNIATHNVMGMNCPLKQQLIMNYIKEFKFDFFGISESKLTTKSAELLWNNNSDYLSQWYCSDDYFRSAGVGLVVHHNYAKYIQEVKGFKGRVLYMKLFLKGRQKIMIIQIYVHASDADKQAKSELYNYIFDLVSNAKRDGFRIIVMGDFNVDPAKLQPRVT